ncbi:nucleoside-diphosphate-sugar epimerase [Nocardia tenerifensis]|uniref:Nucleoside-diphosphate-sugar epimerase n=1 Tax=Nocardia tenerifensis TaxID=228006 RepID=A0A318K4S4_9NOCA|nr:NAD-dependent epimerase/dehydratase family protein [Nocardia tenerifensis]PXX63944.1 nucleoside-diphosphate-sugar epimerase [Nocardia tenerifensis]
MKVVITGATGNVGTALLRSLDGAGLELVGVARRVPPRSRTEVRWISCDIGDPDAIPLLEDAFRGADAVVHLAWAIDPRRDDPPMARTNGAGTEHVLRAVAAAAVPHLICASSAAAYAPGPRWRQIDEDWPRTGVHGSAYSLGKAALESQLDAFERDQPSIRVARILPCGITQAAAAAEMGDWLLPSWLPRSLIGRRWVPVPLWKDLRLQLVHADDVAQAIRLLLERRAAGAFNLAADPVLPAWALVGLFGGFRMPVSHRLAAVFARITWRLGVQPLHPGWLVLADRAALVDSGKARRELGWSPRWDATATAAELARMLRAGRTGASAPLDPAPNDIRLGRPTHQSQDQ